MKNFTAVRPNQIWHNILLFIISFTFLIVWLPFIRSICDGKSYQWGTDFFGHSISGAGITPSLLFVAAQLLFYIALFLSFYWMKERKWFMVLVVLWYLLVFGNLFYDIIVFGDTMFHGDTLNVHVSLMSLVIPLGLVTIILIGLVFYKDRDLHFPGINWNKKNRMMFLILFGPVPLQAIFFATGEPHGITDQIGVVLAILQALLVPLIVRPYSNG